MDNETQKENLEQILETPAQEVVEETFVSETVEETPVQETTENDTPVAEDGTYRWKPEPAPAPQYTPAAPEKPKKRKKGHALKIVALAVCCGVLGGLCGVGGTMLTLQMLAGVKQTPVEYISGMLQGQREDTVIKIEDIDTSKLMTAAEVYAANVNSTVAITASATGTGYWGNQTTSSSAGSGFILSHDGYVLTNYHVVEGMSKIFVTLYDKRQLPATLIGYDESNDIAVLKVKGENLTPVVMGDSDNLNVGDGVVAIGNPLGQLSFTLTAGLISAKDRVVTMQSGATMTLLQTDCPINSGNSGGALFNMYGEVIGITNAKYSSSGLGEASIDNIGFAIPMNRVKEIVFSIIEKGAVVKPFVGISVQDVTAQMQIWGLPKGALITAVTAGSPAEQYGLRVDDIITHMNGAAVESATLVSMVGACKPGDNVEFTVYRGGQTIQIKLVIGEQIQPAT